ncbi:ATP-dependent DNA helicase RecG [Acidothermaceae bacterium B102]|nr:ATP-dependent DNA helicase RecG [Acidothermaceae bacterium B102]
MDVASGLAWLDEPLRASLAPKTYTPLAEALDIHTVADLLRHYPRSYQHRGELTKLGDLLENTHVTVLAEVRSSSTFRARTGKTIGKVQLTDGARTLDLAFFNRADYHTRQLSKGSRAMFSGKVKRFKDTWQLDHPTYQLLNGMDEDAAEGVASSWASQHVVVYPAAEEIDSKAIGKAVSTLLPFLDDVPDPLDQALRDKHGLLTWAQALRQIHQPQSQEDVDAARKRLAWDEAMVLQVALAQRRAEAQQHPTKPRVARTGGLVDAFRARLPFELTAGQKTIDAELRADLAGTVPMHRLLQGEVGSGKTVVALLAMLAVVDAGGQAALLAPTEVLAQQHFRSISAMLGPLADGGRLGGADDATRVALLTGSQATAARREAMLEAASGDAGIVIGTHALLEEKVQFFDLGLVVVDEQHRFGVHQRDALRSKGSQPPHLLVMTATPIPRTVAMTVFGDLEESALTELPLGRSPIQTHVVPSGNAPWVARMWAKVREEVAAGRQAYVVCARIGEGPSDEDAEELDEPDELVQGKRPPAAAVLDVLPALVEGELRGLRVAALHGRMLPGDKDEVMTAFARGEVDVLVATTVIEVGVDVPNATVMVVLDADRFGMSQLHQLRGRVGRGGAQGTCLLEAAADPDGPAGKRLIAVASTLDGFALARLDLQARKEGDVLGAVQSGSRRSLRMLELTKPEHERLIKRARDVAREIVAADPTLVDHPALAHALAGQLDEERSEYLERG